MTLPLIYDPVNGNKAEYVGLCVRTAAPLVERENLLHAVLGIADELLEIFEFFNSTPRLDMNDEETRTKLIKELGDVTWFTALYAQWSFDKDWEDSAQVVFDRLWEEGTKVEMDFFGATTACALHARTCVGLTKKEYAYKKPIGDFDAEQLFVKALGLVNIICLSVGVEIEEVLTRNIAKLAERYKAATFTQAEAINRDEAKE